MPRLLSLSFVCGLFASLADAHEFWIEPIEYQVESGGDLIAHFRNGEAFEGITLGFFGMRSQRLDLIAAGETVAIDSRMGNIPALQITAPRDGLVAIVHETTPSSVTYKDWDKFLSFARHKDFPDIAARHADRALPTSGFKERYTRHVKTLVGVGNAAGADSLSGMETEFVALANPYTDDLSDGLSVVLYYDGEVRRDAQVEVFEKGPDGQVQISLLRTDANGIVRVPVRPGHTYLLDAVVLRPAPDDIAEVWDTLWASLTFHVP